MVPDDRAEQRQKSSSRPGEYRMPLCRKLLLTAAMTGNDVGVTFGQLYAVALLQILGVPVTYVSLYPIVTGPLTMILLNVFGHISDKGSNHQKRKIALFVLNSAIMLIGLAMLIVANLLLMANENRSNWTKESNSLAESSGRLGPNTTGTSLVESTGEQGMTSVGSALADASVTPHEKRHPGENEATSEGGSDLLSIPLTGALGITGFIFYDTGYDLNIAATRACVLACSPKTDHTSILLLALVMAALGGCINNSVGLVDLAAILGYDGDRLVLQTTVQLFVCCLVQVICLTSTVVTACLSLSHLDSQQHGTLHGYDDGYGTFQRDGEVHKIAVAGSHKGTDTEECLEDTTFTIIGDRDLLCDDDAASDHSLTFLVQTVRHEQSSETRGCSSSHKVPQKRKDQSEGASTTRRLLRWKINKHKLNLIIVCLALYLGTSAIYPYNMYAADFLGNVIMGGDSSAAPGSAELNAYEKGVTTAASGLLVFVCCYLLISIVHPRLLDFWGLRVDFCLSHVLMATAVLGMTLSQHVAVFYVTNVTYGFQRSALLSVPFIIVNDCILSQDTSMDRSAVGKMVAAVTCMIPLNFCTLYLISGPLITLTQYDGTPLLLASGSCYMAALIFLIYRP